jgi:hypothetical protein
LECPKERFLSECIHDKLRMECENRQRAFDAQRGLREVGDEDRRVRHL